MLERARFMYGHLPRSRLTIAQSLVSAKFSSESVPTVATRLGRISSPRYATRQWSGVTLYKIFTDLMPLRILLPTIFASILYAMAGYSTSIGHFVRYLLVIVLVNFTCASLLFAISAVTRSLAGTPVCRATSPDVRSGHFYLVYCNSRDAPLRWIAA